MNQITTKLNNFENNLQNQMQTMNTNLQKGIQKMDTYLNQQLRITIKAIINNTPVPDCTLYTNQYVSVTRQRVIENQFVFLYHCSTVFTLILCCNNGSDLQ